MIYTKPVGISILTNGARLEYLKTCISSFLANCFYRPLVFGIYNNGSTDGTNKWITDSLPKAYGVTWRVLHNDEDEGCAVGTNQAIELVKDCDYVLHLESDFELLPEDKTGEDKLWLRRAVEFMERDGCDFMYLRRMVDERDMFMHWWSQWMTKIDGQDGSGQYMRCPGFWWSNNPHIHRTEAMYRLGTLPLDVKADGAKGTPNWSKPEMSAAKPGDTWIHKWGLFVHEKPSYGSKMDLMGCGHTGRLGCKYGFFKDGRDAFCSTCDRANGFEDMPAHQERFVSVVQPACPDVVPGRLEFRDGVRGRSGVSESL